MNKRTNIGIGMTAAAAAAVVLLSGCGPAGSGPAGVEMATVEVRLGTVEARQQLRTQWLPGTVHPVDQAQVASQLMATVAEADFVIGQKVAAGEVLVRLSAREIGAQVEQARAGLAQVERNLARERHLLEQNATTPETVRTLEDQLRVTQARLAEAETMESYATIRAPFAGTITTKEVRRGDLAVPGRPLLTIEGTSGYHVHVQVPDSFSTLQYGDTLQVEADGRRVSGQLAEWSPAADPASRTRLAKLSLADTALRSGQFVRVQWPSSATPALYVPADAIARMGQVERVFVYQDGRLRLRLIRTGAVEAGWATVLAGLAAGDRVVLLPHAALCDGQPATVKP